MNRYFDSTAVEDFVDGAARAFWVSTWGSEMEERGKSFSGKDLMDVAPATPLDAYVQAGKLIGRLEAANGKSIYMLISEADQAEVGGPSSSDFEIDVEYFGHYVAMESMGHGVSWFDDHAEFEMVVPSCEDYYPVIP